MHLGAHLLLLQDYNLSIPGGKAGGLNRRQRVGGEAAGVLKNRSHLSKGRHEGVHRCTLSVHSSHLVSPNEQDQRSPAIQHSLRLFHLFQHPMLPATGAAPAGDGSCTSQGPCLPLQHNCTSSHVVSVAFLCRFIHGTHKHNDWYHLALHRRFHGPWHRLQSRPLLTGTGPRALLHAWAHPNKMLHRCFASTRTAKCCQ